MESTRSLLERFKVNGQSNEYYQSSESPVVKKNQDSSCSYSVDDCFTTLEHFIFPPPPLLEVPAGDAMLLKCLDNTDGMRSSSEDADSNSDSSQSDNYPVAGSNSRSIKSSRNAILKFRGYFNDGSPVNNILSILPPIGVFWDIENCQVPKGRSAVVIAQAIRDKFFHGYRETEFLVVCDVKKENSQVIQELNDAQVNLIHVSSQSKNAADDKLRQAMRRFADIHGPPAAIMLISGDINFSSDLCDLRHRKKIHVILLHNDLCSQSLILCANENHNYSKLVETLPLRGSENLQNNNPVEVLVTNLPLGYDPAKIRNKLKRLSENCGGRVGIITDQTTTIRFSSMEFATRAQKRMNRERVFGNCVFVSTPYNVTDDQDLNKFSAKKNSSLCRSFDHSNVVLSNTKMYHCSNNENFLSVPEYTINDPKNFLPYNKPATYYQNGTTFHCRNDQRGNGYTIPHTNQENITHPNNLPPWWHWNSASNVNKYASVDGVNKSGRQVLMACDGNTKCLPQDPYSVAHATSTPAAGKYDRFWQNENGLIAGSQCQPNSFNDIQKNSLPQVTILKRNGALPSINPLDMNKRYFHPIGSSQTTINPATQTNGPIELHITNLDQCMDTAELRKCLLNAFGEFTTVLSLSVYIQSDGNYAASVKVPSHQDAQFVISKLHRRKIGFKRIMISNVHNANTHNIALIRSQTVSLLLDVPGNQLPLIKFRELYEKRYLVSPSASDLYKLKDICTISEEANGRIISLNAEFRNSPSPLLSFSNDNATPTEQPYCKTHWKPTRVDNDKGWAELEIMSLPNVKISMAVFSKNLHRLVASHNNYLLLTSFCDCYETEFGKLSYDDNGVPLEHLVTCVSGLELIVNNSTGIKYITASTKITADDRKSEGSHSLPDGSCISPSLVNNLALFSRELVDLLKTFPHCTMSFNRFIPAYHHHFGRQCRVADYGYTKLIDLMEALPNVVQVIGEGNRRMLTLAHKAQIRRFTSDLLRVLKSLASKQTTIGEFPTLFEKTIGRPFDPVDYGLCYLDDLLSQISENTVVIYPPSSAIETDAVDTVIAIPKREQTAEEIERTKVFANEVVELLSHAPQCSMLFNKFIPAYHHHYGHQCKVADFGFTKLIELFEAIPEVVKIEDDIEGGDRKVTLREEVKLKVLGDQLVTLVMSRRPNELSLINLNSVFLWQYGYSLKPSAYGFNSLQELIENLNFAVKLVDTSSGPVLQAVDKNQLKFLSLKTKRVLIERSAIGQMFFKDFSKAFASMFGESIELPVLEKQLADTVTVVKNSSAADAVIKLTPLEIFARDVYLLMISCEGKLPLNSFESAYLRMYGTAVQPAVYGYQTIPALLQAIPQTVVIRGKPPKRLILLNTELTSAGFRLPKSLTANNNRFPSSHLTKDNISRYPGSDSLNDFESQYSARNETDSECLFFKSNCNSTTYQASSTRNENLQQIPLVMLPDLALHPDTYTASPLTSPHKSLHNTIMFAEHMLHAPTSRIETPSSVRVPYPLYLNGTYNNISTLNGSQFHDCRSHTSMNSTNATSEQDTGSAAMIPRSCEVSPHDLPISESIASSTDSFSDGTVSSTNKRKVRLAAQFHGYSEN